MKYTSLGSTGVKVSRIALGTFPIGVAPLEADAPTFINRAIDLGINVIDTANSYGNQSRFDRAGAPPAAQRKSAEEIVGKALKGRRNEVILCTKVQEQIGIGPNDGGIAGPGLTRHHIFNQVEESLRRFGTDHIDVYHMHHPQPGTPIEESLRAFDDLVHQGKIRYVAISNFSAWEMTQVHYVAAMNGFNKPVLNQIQYNLIRREPEDDLVPAAKALGMSLTAYRPLAGGFLTGLAALERQPGEHRERILKVTDAPGRSPGGGYGYNRSDLEVAQKLEELAHKFGHKPFHLALAWLTSRPTLACAVVGPEKLSEVEDNAKALDINFTPEQLAEIDALTAPPPPPAPRPVKPVQ